MALNEIYSYECFITRLTKYCLLDDSNDIRDTAPDLQGILHARLKHGWGHIHKCSYDEHTMIFTMSKREMKV